MGIRFTLCITETLSVSARSGPENAHLTRAIDVTQVANLAFTLITNMCATGIVALKAWYARRRWYTHYSLPPGATDN